MRICLSDADDSTRGTPCSGLAPCDACGVALAAHVFPKAVAAAGEAIRKELSKIDLRGFLSARRSPAQIDEFAGAFEDYAAGLPGEPEVRAWLETLKNEREEYAKRVLDVLPKPEPELPPRASAPALPAPKKRSSRKKKVSASASASVAAQDSKPDSNGVAAVGSTDNHDHDAN